MAVSPALPLGYSEQVGVDARPTRHLPADATPAGAVVAMWSGVMTGVFLTSF